MRVVSLTLIPYFQRRSIHPTTFYFNRQCGCGEGNDSFFGHGTVDVAQQLAAQGIRVIIAGLDMDYLGNPFGHMPALMAVAEYVTKVHAICVRCGDIANHSHRLSSSDKLVELGEKDIYEAHLPSLCFNKLKKAT